MRIHLLHRLIPFLLTFAISLAAATIISGLWFSTVDPQAVTPVAPVKLDGRDRGTGYAACRSRKLEKLMPAESHDSATPLRVTFQPKATYTDEARANDVQGGVRLKITLLASGEVGSIVPVTRLPYGLTEKAIEAARQIRFEPKTVNGVPVSVTVTREYTFTIY